MHRPYGETDAGHDVTAHPDDARLQTLLASLPRDAELPPGGEDRVVDALRFEGFLRPRAVMRSWWFQAAAAAAIFAGGAFVGGAHASRNSIEARLARTDLSMQDRVLLLQRAGSAYVRAAHAYADATTQVDSTAVEVASQVLLGAAAAVARRSLDGGMTTRLAAVLQSPSSTPLP